MPSKKNIKKVAMGYAMYKAPTRKAIRTMAAIDILNGINTLALAHPDVYTSTAGLNALDGTPVQSTLATLMWGCKQMATLYQFFHIHRITYQWVPAVAFTWTGTVAAKIIDDAMDFSSNSTINQFMNAPSSMIVPVYAASSKQMYTPKPERKYCFGTYNVTPTFTANGAAMDVTKYMERRWESYGTFQVNTFDIKDPTGATPAGNLVLGRIIMTIDMSYDVPVPINQDTILTGQIAPVSVLP